MKKAFILVTLALAMVASKLVAAQTQPPGQLIGTYTLNYRFNTAGGIDYGPGANDPFNPYLHPSQLPPGPYFVPAVPGKYRVEISAVSPAGGVSGIVYVGDATSGVGYRITAAGVDFELTHGQIALFAHDWVPWDNDPSVWTEVKLYRVDRPTVTFQYAPGNRSGTPAGTPLASPLRVGISFGAHNRTIHLQATVTPPDQADKVSLSASSKLTLSQGAPDTTTGVIPFDIVGNTASDAAMPAGDSAIWAAYDPTGEVIGQQPVAVVVPARIGTPHNQEASTATGINGLFNNLTIPPWNGVFDPFVERVSMYAIINHVIVWDQFGQPIGDADLYGGARILEGGVDLGVVLLPNSTYEDRVGVGVAVGQPVLKTSREAVNWANDPTARPPTEGTSERDVDDIQIDGSLAWSLAIVGRQLFVSSRLPDGSHAPAGQAWMQIIWP